MFLAALLALLAQQPTVDHLSENRGRLLPLEVFNLTFELFLPKDWVPPQGGGGGAVSRSILVFLHGRGESGGFDVTNAQSLPLQLATNSSISPFASSIVLIPQCPARCAHANHWLTSTLHLISKVVREWAVPVLGGDATRVYLTGQSMGGHGAWTYAAQQPGLFAALVVVCGYSHGALEAGHIAERLARARLPVAAILAKCHILGE